MDRNRAGLALMLTLLLLSVVVASMRSCSDTEAHKWTRVDAADAALRSDCYRATAPIRDYQVRETDYGVMTVEAGPTLDEAAMKILAEKLTWELYNRVHADLHSDLVMVEIERHGKTLWLGQTTAAEAGVTVQVFQPSARWMWWLLAIAGLAGISVAVVVAAVRRGRAPAAA